MVDYLARRTMTTMVTRALLSVVMLVAIKFDTASADAIRPVLGPVILARTGVQSTYLWDATPYVTQLVVDNDLGDTGLRALLGTAMSVLQQKAPLSHAKTLILRVVYTRSGAVSPVYGTLTFDGVEKVTTLTASRDAILKIGAPWAQDLANGTTPHDLKVEITGKLPPPQ
jgi:hypothetical protein